MDGGHCGPGRHPTLCEAPRCHGHAVTAPLRPTRKAEQPLSCQQIGGEYDISHGRNGGQGRAGRRDGAHARRAAARPGRHRITQDRVREQQHAHLPLQLLGHAGDAARVGLGGVGRCGGWAAGARGVGAADAAAGGREWRPLHNPLHLPLSPPASHSSLTMQVAPPGVGRERAGAAAGIEGGLACFG